MDVRKPAHRHRSVLRLVPGHGPASVQFLVLGVVSAAVMTAGNLYLAGDPPSRLTPSRPLDRGTVVTGARIALGLLLLFVAAACSHGRRWSIGRHLVQLSRAPTGQVLPDLPRSRRARQVPPLHVLPVRDRELRRPRPLSPVEEQRNLIGRTPLRIGSLRLFENHARAKTFMEGAWREFGWVHLLRSATAVPPAEYRAMQRRGFRDAFVGSPEAFGDEVRRQQQPPVGRGPHRLTNVSPYAVWTWDWYGAYPPVAPLCHVDFWQLGVDEQLLRVDVVVMDLSGFRDVNQGTGFEVQRLVDRFPSSGSCSSPIRGATGPSS